MSYLECLFYFIATIVIIELVIELCKWIYRLYFPTDLEVPTYVY